MSWMRENDPSWCDPLWGVSSASGIWQRGGPYEHIQHADHRRDIPCSWFRCATGTSFSWEIPCDYQQRTDKDGREGRPGISWEDRRGVDRFDILSQQLGKIFRLTAGIYSSLIPFLPRWENYRLWCNHWRHIRTVTCGEYEPSLRCVWTARMTVWKHRTDGEKAPKTTVRMYRLYLSGGLQKVGKQKKRSACDISVLFFLFI